MKAPTPQDHMDIHTTLILLNKAGHDLGDLTETIKENTHTTGSHGCTHNHKLIGAPLYAVQSLATHLNHSWAAKEQMR